MILREIKNVEDSAFRHISAEVELIFEVNSYIYVKSQHDGIVVVMSTIESNVPNPDEAEWDKPLLEQLWPKFLDKQFRKMFRETSMEFDEPMNFRKNNGTRVMVVQTVIRPEES
jgi:hypothetical protein